MDRITTWLHDKIAEHVPAPDRGSGTFHKLTEATEAIFNGRGMVFGMILPPRLPEREMLLGEATEALRAWLPHCDAEHLEHLANVVRRTNLPIDVTTLLAEQTARDADKAKQQRETRASAEPRNPQLEAAVEHDPNAYAVLADWLEAQGSIRGALIHLMIAAETDAQKAEAVTGYLSEHYRALVGPPEGSDVADEDFDDEFTSLRWYRGFIQTVRLARDSSVAPMLEYLLQHPSGRLLRGLEIGMSGESSDFDLEDVVKVLATEKPQSLRDLHLGDFVYPDESEMSWYRVGNVEPLWAALPRLRTLIVQGGEFQLGAISAPALEHLELRTGALKSANLHAIVDADWPTLRVLHVWFGDESFGGDTTIADVDLILSGDFPALKELGLMNAPFADEIVARLVESPLLAQLDVLDLSNGTLGDEGVQTLLANKRTFGHLKRIDVSHSYISENLMAALHATQIEIVAKRMQGPAAKDDRYISVSE